MAGIALAAFLVAYSNLLNLWPPFNRVLYVPLNLTVTASLLLLALGPLGLSSTELGLDDFDAADLALGAGAGAALAAPLFVALVRPRTTRLIADERMKGLEGAQLTFQATVRVPFGTVLLEECAFRGVLFALWESGGAASAAVASSVVFGLWHISPTVNLVRANRPRASPAATAVAVVGAIVFTTGAGIGLAWVRLLTGNLVAPFAMHATVNSLATVAAALAHRRAVRRAVDRGRRTW